MASWAALGTGVPLSPLAHPLAQPGQQAVQTSEPTRGIPGLWRGANCPQHKTGSSFFLQQNLGSRINTP